MTDGPPLRRHFVASTASPMGVLFSMALVAVAFARLVELHNPASSVPVIVRGATLVLGALVGLGIAVHGFEAGLGRVRMRRAITGRFVANGKMPLLAWTADLLLDGSRLAGSLHIVDGELLFIAHGQDGVQLPRDVAVRTSLHDVTAVESTRTLSSWTRTASEVVVLRRGDAVRFSVEDAATLAGRLRELAGCPEGTPARRS